MNSASTCKAKYAEYVRLNMPDSAFHGYLGRRKKDINSAIIPQISQTFGLHVQEYGT